MIFEDFLAYLKTLDLPDTYQDAIVTLKPYGRVSLQFERVLGQPGEALVLSDPESLRCLYQFVYWALNRDAVDVNVPLIISIRASVRDAIDHTREHFLFCNLFQSAHP